MAKPKRQRNPYDENLEGLRKIERELSAFMQTKAYGQIVKTNQADYDMVQQAILHAAPVDLAGILAQQNLFGQRDQLELNITFFDDALVTVKEAIASVGDAQTQARINNENEQQ